MKKRCALEAAKYIKDGMIVGLGGGRTIQYLVEYISESKRDIKVVTPSYSTLELCLKHHLEVLPTCSVNHIDIAFDGCDEVDLNLNALKSGGAIHTNEKIIASIADEYIVLVDESKVFETLPFHHSVTLEVILEAKAYITKQIEAIGGQVSARTSQAKDGYTISDHGLLIMDATFHDVKDIRKLHDDLNQICGIVETSLFVDKITKVISVDEGHVRVIERKDEK